MIHRLALFAASLAASLVLALGLAVAGLVPATESPAADPAAATTQRPPEPTVQVDTVYLTAPAPPRNITVARTVQRRGERGDEHEGGDSD